MPAERKPAKVMDGVHAGATPPPSSSRPVIVTNRPILSSDPMLNTDLIDVSQEKPSGEPLTRADDTPDITRDAKSIVPLAEITDQAATEDLPEQSEQTEAGLEEAGVINSPQNENAQTEPLSEAKHVSDSDEPQVKPGALSARDDVKTSDEPGRQEQEGADEDDPKVVREHEIERHIAAGTYFLPIGQTRRRRLAIAFIFVAVLFVALIALDILLDLDILTLNLPHTNLLK